MNNDSTRLPQLVLGIGNILKGDDGVGVRAVEALAQLRLPDGVELIDGGTGGADLVDYIADRRLLVVLDAVDAGGNPGDLFRLLPEDLLQRETVGLSLHDVGLMESLHMAQLLGCEPDETVILGVQPQTVRLNLELSPPVAGALPKLVDAALAELQAPRPATQRSAAR